MPDCKRWVWTELLGFDALQEDCGVDAYLSTLGFVPEGVSLLIGSPDFILQHAGVTEDAILPPDFCSRNGQEGNENRGRQEWTRFELRKLVEGLRRAGCKVYFSCFTHYLGNRFHREWLSDHPEAKVVSAPEGRRDAIFVLARMVDGTYMQDYFAERLAAASIDYGFDGWHGADGYGPQWAIFKFGFSDDFVDQFAARCGAGALPEFVTAPCEACPEALTRRAEWIWRNRRLEWIAFYTDRWAEFWQAVCDALRAVGRKAMINSAWTKAPFEARYRYGVDYRKIAAAGVDAMMVETCAGGILLGSNERDYHYDYLAMLMLIRACVPGMELIFLHNVKDVAEDWDLLRHAPAMLEREVYALANVYHRHPRGGFGRCVDGFMACLADGVAAAEWRWLDERWALAFGPMPRRVPGATLLWSDALLDRALATFPEDRRASTHHLLFKLLEQNAPVQVVARFDAVAAIDGPLLLLNPHLLSEQERQAVLEARNGLVLIGPDFTGWPEPDFAFRDGEADGAIEIRLHKLAFHGSLPAVTPEASAIPADPLTIQEPARFRSELLFQPVSAAFIAACAEILRAVCGTGTVESQRPENLAVLPPLKIGVMQAELADGTLRVAVKNSATVYGRPSIDLGKPIGKITVRTPFPVTRVEPEGGNFRIVVPPQGVVVMDVQLQTKEESTTCRETI